MKKTRTPSVNATSSSKATTIAKNVEKPIKEPISKSTTIRDNELNCLPASKTSLTKNYAKPLQRNQKQNISEKISYFIWEEIFTYCASDIKTLVSILMVNKKFNEIILKKPLVWYTLICKRYATEISANNTIKASLESKSMNTIQLMKIAKNFEIKRISKLCSEFVKFYTKLYNYGYIKENIPNKLINKLGLQIDININKNSKLYKVFLENHSYKMKLDNNLTHVLMHIPEMKNVKIYDLNTIEFDVIIKSKWLKKSVVFTYKIEKKMIFGNKLTTKAFCYYPYSNFIFVFFENDNKILYSQFEVSAIDIIEKFKQEIQFSDIGNEISKTKYFNTKTLDMDTYIKSQLDFEIHLGLHNHKKNLYDYLNTKLFPIKYDKTSAEFYLDINEKFSSKNTAFYLDDNQGMSEILPYFYSLDLIIKDRDDVLFTYSGFMQATKLKQEIVAKKIKNYFEVNSEDYEIFSLEYKNEVYMFEIVYLYHLKSQDIIIYSVYVKILAQLLKQFTS